MQNYTPPTSIEGPLGTVLTLRYCPNTAFLKLLVLVGKRCDRLMLEKITNIVVQDIQVDEIWGYVFIALLSVGRIEIGKRCNPIVIKVIEDEVLFDGQLFQMLLFWDQYGATPKLGCP